MEFAAIDVRACARSFPNLPRSFDDDDAREAGRFCHELRDWLASIGVADRRIMVQRYEFNHAPTIQDEQSGRFEVETWRVQWDGQMDAKSEWTEQAYGKGVAPAFLASLLGVEPETLANLYGRKDHAPSVKPIAVKQVTEDNLSPIMRNVLQMFGKRL